MIHWTVVATGHAADADVLITRRWLLLRVLGLALIVAVGVSVAAGLVARDIARTAAVDSASQLTHVLALDVVQPALADGVVTENASDVARLSAAVKHGVLGPNVVRVKVWRGDGTIVYSDDPRLMGRTFVLDKEERTALKTNGTVAGISDLRSPDNVYDGGEGPLLEVYRAVHTPNGTPLLLEVYFKYVSVEAQHKSLWTRFAAVIVGSVVLLLAALLPLLRNLVRSLERGHAQRQLLLQRAVDASDSERRRIAALLHDGPVQELVGASYSLGAAGIRLKGTEGARSLGDAEATIRATTETLRLLLVDLYPPSLAESGLEDALDLLAYNAEFRGSTVTVDVGRDLKLSERAAHLTFRVAREAIANAVKHGEGKPVLVTLRREHQQTVLTVTDDGPGFEAESLIANPQATHFGIRILRDAVAESGIDASLAVKSATNFGTSWRLSILC